MTISPRHFALVAILALTGCGGGVGDVTGKVTCNGKPVQVGAVVVLGSDSLPYSGRIDVSGEYRVENVPTGRAKFGVVSHDPNALRPARNRDGDSRVKDSPADVAGKWFPIPPRYAEAATSDIAFDIRRGQNQFDIVLIDDKKPVK